MAAIAVHVEDDPGAPFFNETEKFVVGAQPLREEWASTVALGAYDPAVIPRLKSDLLEHGEFIAWPTAHPDGPFGEAERHHTWAGALQPC